MLSKKPEILSPAGNFEKLKAALLFGGNAVYFSGKDFGMRAAADNFTLDEIEQACVYTHNLKKKLYLTVNIIPKAGDIYKLEEYLYSIKNLKDRPDAVICADIGVVSLVRKILPGIDIHISTQANVQNYLSCVEWAKLGAKRIILSRELTFEDIKTIKQKLEKSSVGKNIELECFVHGSMCVAYSGRCLLSNYYASRDANKGGCAQPCRWKYRTHYISEEKRPGEELEISEDDTGTFLFSSKDLRMVEHIGDLADCGIDSFKIEGRMKSAYYTACITNAYRIALDSYYNGVNLTGKLTDKLIEETQSVSRREYYTGFFYNPTQKNAAVCENPEYIRERIYLGTCIGRYSDGGYNIAVFEQKNKIFLNQDAQILSPGHFGEDIIISNLFDKDDNPIESAPHPMMIFKIKIDEKIKAANNIWREREIKPGDILRSGRPV
ncbi:MAG: U32 family peptidase [Oscillospiraceae bacterium]|nr:U32 family peptidase [Oscillospiraceae bacterium]